MDNAQDAFLSETTRLRHQLGERKMRMETLNSQVNYFSPIHLLFITVENN